MLSFSKTYRNVLFQTLRLNLKRNLIISLLTFISCMVIFSFISRSPETLLANFIGSLLGILAFQLSLLLLTGITTWNQVRETRNKLQEHPDDLLQSSNEENYIGLLTPELLWEYIQKLHQTQITELKQELQQCQADPDYAREFATAILCCQITDWDTSLKHLNPNQLPFCITNSEIHFLYQVYTLYQKTDFKTTDLILYGW